MMVQQNKVYFIKFKFCGVIQFVFVKIIFIQSIQIIRENAKKNITKKFASSLGIKSKQCFGNDVEKL